MDPIQGEIYVSSHCWVRGTWGQVGLVEVGPGQLLPLRSVGFEFSCRPLFRAHELGAHSAQDRVDEPPGLQHSP